MRKLRSYLLVLLILTQVASSLGAQNISVRLKDISKIIEARDNQLVGFGLVVGLRNTGDTKSTVFTHAALTNMLGKLGVSNARDFNSRNVAAVMITATLPPFAKKGQRIPITVSSLGDSTSLVGGTLVMTPLSGPDLVVYAVAQGPVLVGGISENSADFKYYRNQTTVGSIPDGAIVEEEVPVTFTDQHNITIVLKDQNFINASRVNKALQDNGFPEAKALDANTIKVPLSDADSLDLVSTIAKIENIDVVPDASNKIVINSKTGTVVIGEMVRLFPVAVTHGNISIRINDNAQAGAAPIGGGAQDGDQSPVRVDEQESKILYLNPSGTLSSLVNALNEIGATPKDLISIIQTLKECGALIATVEII